GMISVAIARLTALAEWEIDTWLMSCRVLGRKVEQMVLRELCLQARSRGVRRLIGVYRRTDRNDLVKDHYSKLGFTHIGEAPDGSSRWSLDTTEIVPVAQMTVRRKGLEAVEAEV